MAEVQQNEENDFQSTRVVGLTSATSSQKRTFDEYNDLDLARNNFDQIPDALNVQEVQQIDIDAEPSVKKQYKQRSHPDASLVLVGFRGSGRSTLGFIASIILRRRYIDVDHYFRAQTGQTRSRFITQHGLTRYATLELRLMCQLLKENDRGCVIGGLYGLREGSHGISAIQKCLRNMPVVYVIRDQNILQTYLEVDDNKFRQIYESSSNVLRALSDFEFYNITEGNEVLERAGAARHLRLKRIEQDFGQLLGHIFPYSIKHHSYNKLITPFVTRSPEYREYGYALQVPLDWLRSTDSELKEVESGADVVELYIEDVPQLSNTFRDEMCKQFTRLRRHTRVPIILHMNSSPVQDVDRYMEIFKLALKLAPGYVLVNLRYSDEDLRLLMQNRSNTKFIGEYIKAQNDDGRNGNQDVTAAIARAQQLGMAMIRIIYQQSAQVDPFKCQHLVEVMRAAFSIPITAYVSNAAGKTSICFNKTLSPVVLPSLSETGVTLRDAQTALHSSFILEPKKYYIVGKDVSFSLSPAMHSAAYLYYGMPHSYEILQTNTISDIQRLLNDQSTGGIAVSLPYKIDAIEFVDELDEDAQAIGAINTILLQAPSNLTTLSVKSVSGRSHDLRLKTEGYNTDFIGIHNCIHRKLSTANTIRHNSTALIIGSGGMARASIYACLRLGFKQIFVYNRTYENAEKIAKYFIDRTQTEDKHLCQFFVIRSLDDVWPEGQVLPTVIISTIPAHQIGDTPSPNLTLPEAWLLSHTGGVFVELSYKPVMTQLLVQIIAKNDLGWITIDGLDILLEQGIAQFELYTGRPAPVHVMRKAVRDRYGEAVSRSSTKVASEN